MGVCRLNGISLAPAESQLYELVAPLIPVDGNI